VAFLVTFNIRWDIQLTVSFAPRTSNPKACLDDQSDREA